MFAPLLALRAFGRIGWRVTEPGAGKEGLLENSGDGYYHAIGDRGTLYDDVADWISGGWGALRG